MPVVILALMGLAALTVGGWVLWTVESVLAVVLLWGLAFFRDPVRVVPEGDDILVSPADGCVTDIDIVDELWENIPEPYWHLFRSSEPNIESRRVILLRRVR